MGRLADYSSYYGFFSLLARTKKYQELYSGGDAIVSVFAATITTGVLCYLLDTISTASLNSLVKNVLVTVGAGLIGLLGFLVSGLAILTGVITTKVLRKLDEQKKIDDFVEILFSFYFEGAVIGITIFGLLLTYLVVHAELDNVKWVFLLTSFSLAYFFWFSIVYAVGLVGTCINVFFVNIFYEMDFDRPGCDEQPPDERPQNDEHL